MILTIYIIGFIAHYILVLLMTALLFNFDFEFLTEQKPKINSAAWAFKVFRDGLIWPITWTYVLINLTKKL